MKKIYILLFVLPLIGFGQVFDWEQTFGGYLDDKGIDVKQTSDGGYILIGYTSIVDTLDNEVYLIKTDQSGNEQWSQIFNNSGGFGHSVIQQTSDGGYLVVGKTGTTMNDGDGYLMKLDENGTEQWIQTFPSNWLYSFQQTSDEGYIICGHTDDNEQLLIKTTNEGMVEWSQIYNPGHFHHIINTTDGGYIMTGLSSGEGSVLKTDGNGNEEWSQTFGENLFHVEETSDGGYIMTGRTYYFESDDVYVLKTDGNGNEEWSQTFGGTGDDCGRSVQQTSDGGYVLTGYTESFGIGGKDVYVLKTDENGNEEWTQTYGGSQDDFGNKIRPTSDGGYILIGYTESFGNGGKDVYLIKLKNDQQTSLILEPILSKRQLVKTTNILGQENTTIKNQPLIEIYDDGSTEKKIVIE